MSDAIRRILEEQERMRKLLNPYEDLQRYINPLEDQLKKYGLGSAALDIIRQEEERQKLLSGLPEALNIKNELDKIERQRQLLRGPVDEMRRLGLLDGKIATQSAVDKIIEDQARYHQQFRLPETSELSALAHIAMKSDLTQMVMGSEATLKNYLATMQSPWLQIEDARTSALGLSELVSIGRGIDIYSAYDHSFAQALRSELGDWRDISMPSSDVLTNPISRSEFYRAQGFNSDLTDFTSPAFYDGLRAGGLRSDEQAEDLDDDEDGFKRADEVFAKLLRFETALRRFIEDVMEKEFGPKWMKQQLPSNMLASWEEKKEKAINAGHPEFPLIDYADFSDYKMIIEKRDNWDRVFKHVFGRSEDVRESFQRLFPIRIATMHARLITNDDELLLHVEIKRVLKAIDARK
jgi:hypothetical protein